MNLKFKVISDSMAPVLRVGDELDVAALPPEPKVFDILLFQRHQRMFVHFVWRYQKSQRTIVTRSLKNPFCDEEPVMLSEVIGKIDGVHIGFLRRWKILGLNLLRGTY